MNAPTRMSHLLTSDEIEHYHEHGYVIQRWRLPADLLARMRADLDALLEANQGVSRDSMFCPHIVKGGTQGLSGSNEWLEYARIPEVLDLVAQVVGPDFLLWGTTVFGKPAGTGKRVTWHQDGEYWPIRPLATCSAWIALDDATPENGCLRIIPGSHKQRRLRAHTQKDSPDLVLNQELNAEAYDEADAVDLVLEAGQFSLHDVYLVHGSEPNRSTKRRACYVCRYMPTTSHFDHDYGSTLQARSGNQVDFSGRALWQMRGKDVCGKNNFSVGH